VWICTPVRDNIRQANQMTKRPASRDNQIVVWLLAAVFSLLWIYIGALSLPQGRVHDFQYSYGAARLVLEGRAGDLYGPSLVSGLDRGVPFDRPAVAALPYVPFALLPLDTAFVCYTALWIVLLLVCWAWGYRKFGPFAVLLASMFMPATLGLAHAQDCVLYLALLIWSYSLAQRERPFAAGCAVGLMVLKFHLVLLWPVALILQRRWRMLAGFAATSSLLAAVSVAMVGISGTRAYIAVLLQPSPVSPSPEFQLSFTGLLMNLGIDSMAVEVIVAMAIFGLFVLGLRHAPLPRLYAVTTAASLALVPHAYGYDAARLLLPIWLVYAYAEWRVARTAAVLMATPLIYSFTLLGKPWAAVGSMATLTFLVLLAIEPFQTRQPAKAPLAA
jgi:hypothetical protein